MLSDSWFQKEPLVLIFLKIIIIIIIEFNIEFDFQISTLIVQDRYHVILIVYNHLNAITCVKVTLPWGQFRH